MADEILAILLARGVRAGLWLHLVSDKRRVRVWICSRFDWLIFVALLGSLILLGYWFRRYMCCVADFIAG